MSVHHPFVNASNSLVLRSRVPDIPDDVVIPILDHMLQGPLIQSLDHLSRISDNGSSSKMLDDLQSAKKGLCNLRLANKRFGRLGAPRLFQILMIWPARDVGKCISDLHLKQLVGGVAMSSFVKTIVFRFGHVNSSMVRAMLRIVESCNGLETFHLFADCFPREGAHQIFMALRARSSQTLLKLECFLPHGLSHLPLLYGVSFPNLRILTSAYSKTNPLMRPQIVVPFPPESPFVTQIFSFEHMHSLRIGDPALFYKQVQWMSPNLKALTLDSPHDFEVEELLFPFLGRRGSQLVSLDTQFIGPRRLDVYRKCPNLVDFVLHVGLNPCIIAPIDTLMHERITRIGVRGCSSSFWDMDEPSMDIFRFLGEFIRRGAYPSLREVHLLDFDPTALEHFPWDRGTAWNWLYYIVKYKDLGILLLDHRGKKCEAAKLQSLHYFAEELEYVAARVDGVFRRPPPS